MRMLRTFLLVTISIAALSACGSGGAPASTSATTQLTTQPTTASSGTAAQSNELRDVDGVIATARGELAVFAAVDDTTPSSTLPAKTSFGSPTTVLVQQWQGTSGAWLKVLLPVRPNGSTGYVRVADVTLSQADKVVDVDLGAKRLRVVGRDGVLIDTPIAIGSPKNPTPTGSYYVTDVLDTQNDGGAYGPFAIGVSAHSDTLTEFAGGDGDIGIHGTNQPSSIGNAVSHGCVRVPNDVVVQLAGMLPLGTPVTIH
jgi:lipoprotein-anchoring transpeptidase ErfK/SrfK